MLIPPPQIPYGVLGTVMTFQAGRLDVQSPKITELFLIFVKTVIGCLIGILAQIRERFQFKIAGTIDRVDRVVACDTVAERLAFHHLRKLAGHPCRIDFYKRFTGLCFERGFIDHLFEIGVWAKTIHRPDEHASIMGGPCAHRHNIDIMHLRFLNHVFIRPFDVIVGIFERYEAHQRS